MNCPEIQEQLSAYFDGELEGETLAALTRHLESCAACQAKLDGFRRLSALSAELRRSDERVGSWEALEHELAAAPATLRRAVLPAWIRGRRATFALAAVVLVGFGVGWAMMGLISSRMHSEQVVADFHQYLDTFEESPSAAHEFLLARYDATAVDLDDVRQQVGYTPVVASASASHYPVHAVYVWRMPCCTCVECVWRRDDGTDLVIFEHDDQHGGWLDGRETALADCAGKQCRLLQVDGQVAASWRHGSRHLVVIGAHDEEEIATVVDWLHNSKQGS